MQNENRIISIIKNTINKNVPTSIIHYIDVKNITYLTQEVTDKYIKVILNLNNQDKQYIYFNENTVINNKDQILEILSELYIFIYKYNFKNFNFNKEFQLYENEHKDIYDITVEPIISLSYYKEILDDEEKEIHFVMRIIDNNK